MPLNQFGTYSPQIIEPFPAENEVYRNLLSPSPSPLAIGQMGMLGQMHDVGQAAYNQQLGLQHDLAIRQIQQQMAENAIKALHEGGTTPGVAGLIAASPFLSSQVFGGAGPDAIGQFVTDSEGNIRLGQQKMAGEAAKSYADAGVAPPLTTLGGLTNTNLQPAMSVPERVATIDAQGRIQASMLGGGGFIDTKVQTGKYGPNHQPIEVTVKDNPFWPPTLREWFKQVQLGNATGLNAPGSGTLTGPPVPPTPGTGGQAPGTAPTSGPGIGKQGATSYRGDPGNTDTSNPLLGDLGQQAANTPGFQLKPGSPTGTNLPPAPKVPAGQGQTTQGQTATADTTATTTQPPSTGSVLPGAQAAEPQTQASTGESSASASSPGQQKAPAIIKLPNTPPGQVESSAGGKMQIALQGKARQALAKVDPEARDAITKYRGLSGGDIPIRIIDGVPYIIHPKTGQRLVPLT